VGAGRLFRNQAHCLAEPPQMPASYPLPPDHHWSDRQGGDNRMPDYYLKDSMASSPEIDAYSFVAEPVWVNRACTSTNTWAWSTVS